MKESDIKLSSDKAKPLHCVYNDGLLNEYMQTLKELLKRNGLSEGIIRIQIFAENRNNEKDILSSIEFTDKGCMLYYTEFY